MSFRMIMVRMMPDGVEPALEQAFSLHDRSGLPESIGAVHRSLYSYHGIYLHLVEAPRDIRGDLAAHSGHPAFRAVDKAVTPLLRPVDPNYPSMSQAQARCFYEWNAS